MKPTWIQDVTMIDLSVISDERGWLVALEDAKLGLGMRRFFAIGAMEAVRRGDHAHKACTQILFCLTGRIRVGCDDGRERADYLLEGPDRALFIPPGIWSSQDYEEGAILGVLCDRVYEPEDYLRDYSAFQDYRAVLQGRQ